MSACPAIAADTGGIADALRSVDCLSGQATATAFSRLFGAEGALTAALTLVLTLYVGLLAVNLLTGRSKLGLSTLTPRAFALGLALTFATSWVAYQSVVWNLAVGAPDQIAGIVTGTHGSATALFADRLDGLFDAVSDAATGAQAAQGDKAPRAAGFSPADLLWLGALMLLMGTVGVLLVTRIALATLLALGPVFVILSLFRGTRGLFEGWLKGVALFALTPLFAVLIGGGAVAILSPVVRSLAGGEVDMRAAVTVLLAAAVHCALMAIALKICVTITAGWRLPGGHEEPRAARDGPAALPAFAPGGATPLSAPAVAPTSDRVREIVAGAGAALQTELPATPTPAGDRIRPVALATDASPAAPLPASDPRARGIGSQYRLPTPVREISSC